MKPESPAKKFGIVIIAVVVGIVVSLVVTGFAFGFLGSVGSVGSVDTSQRSTWNQYGISMQYPGGLQPITRGVLATQANDDSGIVQWAWNHAQTVLQVGWVTTPTYSISGGFQGAYDQGFKSATNVVLLDNGTITMGGHSWQYRTYSFTQSGNSYYTTWAISYYSLDQRAYLLFFIDTSSGTLAQVESYGASFSG